MRTTHLAFALPDVDDAEISAITDVVRSGWVTTGPVAQKFEAEFGRKSSGRNEEWVRRGAEMMPGPIA